MPSSHSSEARANSGNDKRSHDFEHLEDEAYSYDESNRQSSSNTNKNESNLSLELNNDSYLRQAEFEVIQRFVDKRETKMNTIRDKY